MKATTTIRYEDALDILGPEYEAALDCMWDSNEFEDEVSFGDFLRAWTEYIDSSARFASQNNLL